MNRKTSFDTGIAFLWDESFVWGLMTRSALRAAGLQFELVNAAEIRNGCLENFKLLFVPGGWASNKLKALGEEGINEIRRFVMAGGSYVGFCGGAGLATREGIGLLNIKRKPTKERVPSFSGRIRLNIAEHKIWKGIEQPVFHAWWPSQFVVDDREIRVLATYGTALPDAFSSDLNVGDIQATGIWTELEKTYQINLDPQRLMNEPAVVEGSMGKGKVILSLIHFDTPDDMGGAVVLRNLWEYLDGQQSDIGYQPSAINEPSNFQTSVLLTSSASDIIAGLEEAVTDLISSGERNFLWFWRNPMLLQWRRGVRGLEYCALYVMIKEIAEMIRQQSAVSHQSSASGKRYLSPGGQSYIEASLEDIKKLLLPFVDRARQLLILERFAMQNGHITYGRCEDPEIQKIRNELFSSSKSHGGAFKELIDAVDRLLWFLLKPKVFESS